MKQEWNREGDAPPNPSVRRGPTHLKDPLRARIQGAAALSPIRWAGAATGLAALLVAGGTLLAHSRPVVSQRSASPGPPASINLGQPPSWCRPVRCTTAPFDRAHLRLTNWVVQLGHGDVNDLVDVEAQWWPYGDTVTGYQDYVVAAWWPAEPLRHVSAEAVGRNVATGAVIRLPVQVVEANSHGVVVRVPQSRSLPTGTYVLTNVMVRCHVEASVRANDRNSGDVHASYTQTYSLGPWAPPDLATQGGYPFGPGLNTWDLPQPVNFTPNARQTY